MTITPTPAGVAIKYIGADGTYDSPVSSTATSVTQLSLETSLIRFDTATVAATGSQYGLAAGKQGQMVTVIATATVNMRLDLDSGTATGRLVFTSAGDNTTVRFVGDTWFLIANNGPTFSTATSG